MRSVIRAVAPSVTLVLLVLAPALPAVAAPATERASVRATATGVKAPSNTASISANGRFVAFFSESDDLVGGDNNGVGDVFVRDRTARRTRIVSVDNAGVEGDDVSGYPAISGNGRWVAFLSSANNLAAGDDDAVVNVYLHDRKNRRTRFIHRSTGNAAGNGSAFLDPPAISHDGRFVAYGSEASNLVGNDGNGVSDVFVFDRSTGRTRRVSLRSNGTEVPDPSPALNGPSISDDGRLIAFDSEATFVGSDNNGASDAYLYDRRTRRIELISRRANGNAGNNGSFNPDLNPSGRLVAFETDADDLIRKPGGGVAPDANGNTFDVLVYDRDRRRMHLVSVRSSGKQGNMGTRNPSISNGRFVAFESDSKLHRDDGNGLTDIYVHDRRTGRTSLASVRRAGVDANGVSYEPYLTADGRWVAFHSNASNLVRRDGNAVTDVFVRGPL